MIRRELRPLSGLMGGIWGLLYVRWARNTTESEGVFAFGTLVIDDADRRNFGLSSRARNG